MIQDSESQMQTTSQYFEILSLKGIEIQNHKQFSKNVLNVYLKSKIKMIPALSMEY